MSRSLVLGFDPSGLDPKVVSVLDDLVTSLQVWAGTLSADLTVKGPMSGVQPRARYWLATAPTIPNGATTPVNWPLVGQNYPITTATGTATFDNGVLYGQPFLKLAGPILTPPLPGQYAVQAAVTWAAAAGGTRITLLETRQNGVWQRVHRDWRVSIGAGAETTTHVSAFVTIRDPLIVGSEDAIRLSVYQDSGAGLALKAGFENTYIELQKIS